MNAVAGRSLSIGLITISLLAVGLLLSQILPAGALEEENTIVAGNRVGLVKLGMKENKVKATLGKDEGAYSLHSGLKVVLYQWQNPDKLATMRVFYDRGDRVVQISATAPFAATTDGISLGSNLADIKEKHKSLECFKYKTNDQRIDYYDDVKQGIAFEFAWPIEQGKTAKRLRSILVHGSGILVIPDSDEVDL